MVGTKEVYCKKCGKALFYIPDGYEMSIKVLCIDCGNNKRSSKKKQKQRTAVDNYVRIRKGKRLDVHPTYCFRSPPEANFARLLSYLGKIDWKFEERVFTFAQEEYQRGPWQYIPDFEVKKSSHKIFTPGFYEIKGWMNPESRSRLRRFRKHYPKEAAKMTVILQRKSEKKATKFCIKNGFRVMYIDELAKEYAEHIPTWE